jgi:hypothetical protein
MVTISEICRQSLAGQRICRFRPCGPRGDGECVPMQISRQSAEHPFDPVSCITQLSWVSKRPRAQSPSPSPLKLVPASQRIRSASGAALAQWGGAFSRCPSGAHGSGTATGNTPAGSAGPRVAAGGRSPDAAGCVTSHKAAQPSSQRFICFLHTCQRRTSGTRFSRSSSSWAWAPS